MRAAQPRPGAGAGRAGGSAWPGPSLCAMSLPLEGRVALVTGVSRRRGIGYAVAARLAQMGASLFVHHWSPHDADQPWGADPVEDVLAGLRDQLRGGARLGDAALDLADQGAPQRLVEQAGDELGHLDVLVCNQAQSGDDGPLDEVEPTQLERHWRVDALATILLTQAFAAQHDGRDGGRVVWMTSGQGQGPMSHQLGYAAAKAMLAGLTLSVADDLAGRAILLNTVNPGPVNTGYLDDAPPALAAAFPQGRLGEPEDPARLIGWLVSDEGRWVVGQVLSSEGGFRR